MALQLLLLTLLMLLPSFFYNKTKNRVNQTRPNNNVYNGKNKLIVPSRNFMTRNDVRECMLTLNNKKM